MKNRIQSKRDIILFFGLFISNQIMFAQPPPPDPGGSGNAGASIDVALWLLIVLIVLYSVLKSYRKDGLTKTF